MRRLYSMDMTVAPSTWTKINFKYPPTPGDSQAGPWASHEEHWSIHYEVE